MKILNAILIIALLGFATTPVYSESGPYTKVEYIYSRTDTAAPFIQFSTGSMPGCYGNKGGYLKMSDKEGTQRTYSLLLTALTSKRDVKVYYEFRDVAPDYNGWGLCQITAINIR